MSFVKTKIFEMSWATQNLRQFRPFIYKLNFCFVSGDMKLAWHDLFRIGYQTEYLAQPYRRSSQNGFIVQVLKNKVYIHVVP